MKKYQSDLLADAIYLTTDDNLCAIEKVEKIKKLLNQLMLSITVAPKKKISIWDFVSKKGYNPILCSNYYKNGFVYACDSHILAKLKDEYKPELEGKIINIKGEITEGKYPDAESVIPKDESLWVSVKISLQKILDALQQNKIKEKMKSWENWNYFGVVNGVWYRLEYLKTFVTLAEERNMKIYINNLNVENECSKVLVAKNEKGETLVLMNCRESNSGDMLSVNVEQE